MMKVQKLRGTTGAGALGSGFWGMLFGLLILSPLLGMAVGVTRGALLGRLREVGIGDDFIGEVGKSARA